MNIHKDGKYPTLLIRRAHGWLPSEKTCLIESLGVDIIKANDRVLVIKGTWPYNEIRAALDAGDSKSKNRAPFISEYPENMRWALKRAEEVIADVNKKFTFQVKNP